MAYLTADGLERVEFEELLNAGINAVKKRNFDVARSLLNKAVMLNSGDPRPWLWLSATSTDLEEQRQYLANALAADPGNEAAQHGMALLEEKLGKLKLATPGVSVQPKRSEPIDAQSKTYPCPNCGGNMAYDIHKGGLTCQFCGYKQDDDQRLAADAAETSAVLVLQTQAGHRWAEAQQRVTCEACGALTLAPPGQMADTCPYCGSNRMIRSPELAELVEPQVVALMKIDGERAESLVRKWLSRGLLAPDDLALRAAGLRLRPAYYPFWTFDGAVEIPWACEVNVGSRNAPQWVPQNGVEFESFDDVLVAGLKAMSQAEAESLEPFNLKDLVAFKPEYLAGWPMLSYNLALADASLRARDKVLRPLRTTLPTQLSTGQPTRNFRFGAGNWADLTFKHVLLPLWTGTYHFQGQDYRVLVNGQTGKVSGKKPRDNVKLAGVSVGGILILIALALVAYWLWMLFGGG